MFKKNPLIRLSLSPTIKTILNRLLFVSCAVLLLINSLTLAIHSLGQNSPWQLFAINNDDMGKNLPNQSLVLTSKIRPNKIAENLVVSFQNPQEKSRLIVRRIERILNDNGERLIITKADNRGAVDTWLLTDQQIVGVYRAHLPLMGSWLNFLATTVGTLSLIIIPGLLIVINELIHIVKLWKTKKLIEIEFEPVKAV